MHPKRRRKEKSQVRSPGTDVGPQERHFIRRRCRIPRRYRHCGRDNVGLGEDDPNGIRKDLVGRTLQGGCHSTRHRLELGGDDADRLSRCMQKLRGRTRGSKTSPQAPTGVGARRVGAGPRGTQWERDGARRGPRSYCQPNLCPRNSHLSQGMTYSECLNHMWLARREFPPPDKFLSKEEEYLLRRLQTNFTRGTRRPRALSAGGTG